MKKIIFTVSFLLLYCNSYSQSGWFRVSDSIPDLVIMSMQFTSDNTGFIVGSYGATCPGGVLKTTNAGLNWQFTNFPNFSADDVSFPNVNTGYICSWFWGLGSYVIKTTNSGVNWICTDTIMKSFFKMKFFDVNTGIVASKYSTVHKTTDGGYNWIAQTGVNWMEPYCIWCFDADNWLVTDKSNLLNKTTNGGVNWSILNFNNFELGSLFFINSTTGFSSTQYGGIYKTTNRGDNWVRIDSIVHYQNWGNIFFVNENTGYVCGYGSYGNIYKTTNGGYNWIPQSTNTNKRMYYIYFTNSNTGYVGGENGIIYKTTNGGVWIKQTGSQIPEKYLLYQNYPNPFNPVTKIKFDIPNSPTLYKGGQGEVSLKIFDITGREIQTLVYEKLNPGTYEVTFDGTNLTSGVYFYQLKSNEYVETKKLVLLK